MALCMCLSVQFKLRTRWYTSSSAFTYVSKSVTARESGVLRLCLSRGMKYVGVCGGVG